MFWRGGCLILHGKIYEAPRHLAFDMNSATCSIPFMKYMSRRLLAISVGFFVLASAPSSLQAKSGAEQVCVSVGRLLEEGHYTHQPLNDDVSRKLLQSYLELLDFSHLFFTQGDIDA